MSQNYDMIDNCIMLQFNNKMIQTCDKPQNISKYRPNTNINLQIEDIQKHLT